MSRYLAMDDAGRERKKAYVAAYKRSLRMQVIVKYGGVCVCCQESEPAFLTIEHVGGGGTKARGNSAYAEYRRIMDGPLDPTRYEVLCANCNMARMRDEGCPHQAGKYILDTLGGEPSV